MHVTWLFDSRHFLLANDSRSSSKPKVPLPFRSNLWNSATASSIDMLMDVGFDGRRVCGHSHVEWKRLQIFFIFRHSESEKHRNIDWGIDSCVKQFEQSLTATDAVTSSTHNHIHAHPCQAVNAPRSNSPIRQTHRYGISWLFRGKTTECATADHAIDWIQCASCKCDLLLTNAPPTNAKILSNTHHLLWWLETWPCLKRSPSFRRWDLSYIYMCVCFQAKTASVETFVVSDSIKFKCLPQWKKYMNSNVHAMVSVASVSLNLYRLHLTSNMEKAAARVHTFFFKRGAMFRSALHTLQWTSGSSLYTKT